MSRRRPFNVWLAPSALLVAVVCSACGGRTGDLLIGSQDPDGSNEQPQSGDVDSTVSAQQPPVQFTDLGLDGSTLLDPPSQPASPANLQKQDWTALSSADERLWAVSSTGYVLSWLASDWPLSASNASLVRISTSPLSAVWAANADDVFVVSEAGEIFRRQHGAWYRFGQTDRPDAHRLNGVWGATSDDVWAVGDSGTLLHFDGTFWSATYVGRTGAPALPELTHIVGTSANDILTAGGYVRLHYDGTRWTREESITYHDWDDVFAGPDRVIWLTGVWHERGPDRSVLAGYVSGVETQYLYDIPAPSAGFNPVGIIIGAFCRSNSNELSLFSPPTESSDGSWTTFQKTSSCVTDLWGNHEWTWAVGDAGLLLRLTTPQAPLPG